jgi:thiol-disulfide isomerase/thioredoxin
MMRTTTTPAPKSLQRLALFLTLAGALFAQFSVAQFSAIDPKGEETERAQINQAIVEANHSPIDVIAALEKHLRNTPNTHLRGEIEQLLAKESMEAKDTLRIVRYGVPTLMKTPNDAQLLDRVTASLLNIGGADNAQKALEFARRFEEYVVRVPVPTGSDAVRNQEDHDRALERSLLYQARAFRILGKNEEARIKAELAFRAYPEEASAREWADALDRAGRPEDAVKQMAAAFVIPDSRASEEDRNTDRRVAADMYRKLHDGSDAGLGDIVLQQYDQVATILDKRHKELYALDPNYGLTDPAKFVLDGLEGNKLPLSTLKGKVVILDFWATWCGPCRAQHPLYEEVRRRFEGRGDVVLLSIDADDDRSVVSPFLDSVHWSRAVYFETGLARALQVANIPTTVILDKEGRLARRMNGFLPDRFVDQLSDHIRDILAGPDAGPPPDQKTSDQNVSADPAPAPRRELPATQLPAGQHLGGPLQ